MKYSQPSLPYEASELAPAISERTVEIHYGRHEKAYIDKVNQLVRETEFEDMELEDIVRNAPEGALLNNAAQAWNHIFYFFSFNPDGGGEPKGCLRNAIEREFGSVDNFKTAFVDGGVGIFGSGWIWLAADNEGRLFIIQGKNADNPMRQGLHPLLTFDVWEHAYYLDYENLRAKALENLWQIVDWPIVEARYRNICNS